ncbi:hypothetical protein PV327_007910 [Microctonus hyperodae]|uniref:Uncharacterized protein n=1 Tax=Microctonus hyperodae TaxID=165561 RepID=A0AA39G066_MICHY|nr:hypothetical protein PV327_007910 [Microctonus hyperodae]
MSRMNRNQERCQQQQQQQQNNRVYNNRIYQNRQQNLNQHYQNPDFLRIIRELNRNRELQEHEENIYERLDSDDDDDDNDVNNIIVDNNFEEINESDRNEINNGDHTYERIDNRPWYRGNINSRANNCNGTNNFSAASSSSSTSSAIIWNTNRYDTPRDFYLSNNDCFNNRFVGLSRNCFSTDNVALATNGRYVYHVGHNCMCQFCTRLPFIRYHICQRCNSFHDRLRCYDSGNPTDSLSGNTRHYIYQVSRSCRCSYCRGEYSFPRFPISASRLVDSLRRGDCQCRNSTNCSCRNRMFSSSNSAIYIGRIGFVQSVNNPLYANPTIYVGRLERPSCSASSINQEGGAIASGSSGADVNINEPSTSSASQSIANTSSTPSVTADAGPSVEQRINSNPGPSNVLVLPINNIVDRQHTCDDSCIRNHPNNVSVGGGLCQFVNRTERSECHSSGAAGGRISYHWWFVNRWLPPWGSQNERNSDSAPRVEEPRDPPGSDSDEGLN